MKRVVEICNFYSLMEIKEYIDKGGEYPLHHIWCFDKLKDAGFSPIDIPYRRSSFLNYLGSKIGISNLQQQINCLLKYKEYDIIFAPVLTDLHIFAFLKFFKIIKKPIIAISHQSFSGRPRSILKRIKQRVEYALFFGGIDKILFLNEVVYNEWHSRHCRCGANVSFISSWGVDVDFFDNYIALQQSQSKGEYIFTTGHANRDFNTLIRAVSALDIRLCLVTKYNYPFASDIKITSNITIITNINPGFTSVSELLPYYYNSLAVAIPLEKETDIPTGITVLFEALALGKAIITTRHRLFPFDIEKENVGFYVDIGDTEGWKNAVNYFVKNPTVACEMGERGRALCKERYNYDLFCNEIISVIAGF